MPAQKSNSFKNFGKKIIKCENIKIIKITKLTERFLDQLSSSLKKVIAGCIIPIEDVSPAIKRRKNHIKDKNTPYSNPSKIAGIAINPILNAPEFATTIAPDIPKKATAAGITIEPPKTNLFLHLR